MYHPHDGVVIHYGADHEITLTHVPDSGLRLADNDKMLFGKDSDSEIYHNGNNFYISNDTGNALLYSDTFQFFSHTGSELFAQFNHNAAVNLYYDSAKKFETTSTGISVTGGVSALTNPGVGNDQMYMGFSAPNGMLYSKNSSGAPASNLFMGTTDGSGNTNNVLSLHYDGKVGIGTTSPSNLLHVYGASEAALTLGAANTRSGLFLHKPGTTTVMGSALLLASDETFRLGTATVYHMQMYQNGSINFYASGSIAATLATTGNLGIGTTCLLYTSELPTNREV